jgi:ribose/xylose/arabinose/galactoside ABC-type transport system permease subunit
VDDLFPEGPKGGGRAAALAARPFLAGGESFLRGRSIFGPPGVYAALGILLLVAVVFEPTVVSRRGLALLLNQNAAIGLLAVGQTFVMLTGGIDLSVGSVVAITNWVAVGLLAGSDARNAPAILLCLALGLAVGFVNGFGVAKLSVPPFVMTLGMLFAVKAAGLMYTNAILTGNPSPFLIRTAGAKFGGFPVPFLVLLVTVVIAALALKLTTFGRRVYAVGANAPAARLAGVRVDQILIATYMISGFTAALGGLIWTGYIQTGSNSAGLNFELQSIAAAVIGGTALVGGRCNPIATLAGVLFLGLLFNLLVVLDVAEAVRFVLQGSAIIAAAAIYARAGARR